MLPIVTGVNLGTRFHLEPRGLDSFTGVANVVEKLIFVDIPAAYAGYSVTFDDSCYQLVTYFRTMPERMKISLERAHRVVAVMNYHDVQGAWQTQSEAGNWADLNAQYLAWKIAEGLDRRTLIQTGDALASLGVEIESGLNLIVGVTAEDGGEAYMVTHEFGSNDGRIPPRPLFTPTLQANLDRYARVFIEAIQAAIDGRVYQNYAAGAIGA
jgi:hypothetical protein